jgi:hypothetical protein
LAQPVVKQLVYLFYGTGIGTRVAAGFAAVRLLLLGKK